MYTSGPELMVMYIVVGFDHWLYEDVHLVNFLR